MIVFFPDLPDGVRLAFLFGIKELTHDGKHYTFLGQEPNEPARYEVENISSETLETLEIKNQES